MNLPPDLPTLLLEHIAIVALSIALAAAIGIPAGIAVTRQPALERWVVGLANIAQTVPSLALFGFLITLPILGGIGPRPAIVALILYALLPIIRNTVAGIEGIDPALRESALAIGMRPSEMLRYVEIPLAARTILAGVRIAAVTTIGTATIAAAIGGGGLGVLIFRGLASLNTAEILAGAAPAALLALVTDGGLAWCERRLSR